VTIPLESLAPCFQGIIPATLYTCSKEGIPNVAMLSHVEYVDSHHVALSFQFFNKSRANIAENPQALVRIIDPDTSQGYALSLRFERSETEGPLFDSMSLRIEAIASYSGLKGIFKLLAADIYKVLSVEKSKVELGAGSAAPSARPRPADALFTLKSLQELSGRVNSSATLEALIDSILAALEDLFGFSHSMILLPGGPEGRLVTIASRGYPENGAGSEVAIGEGIVGMVAEARKPIRISGLLRGMLYAGAVRRKASEQGICPEDRRIPLPGLPQPESQLGIPLLARGDLVGVLCAESEKAYRFHEEDKAYLEVLGSYIAVAIQNMLLRERHEEAIEEAAGPQPPAAAPAPSVEPGAKDRAGKPETARKAPKRDASRRREIAYYRADECVLVDGDYLIRSLPAKILWKILSEHRKEGRTAFTNRGLRLDHTLNLPEFRDNLESRLLLLRRRLEQRCPEIRLVPCGRGRFSLELGCEVALVERP